MILQEIVMSIDPKYSWSQDAKEWIDSSQDTNEYCERNLVIAAMSALEENNSDEAKRRLLQVFSSVSELVDVPDHVEEP